MNSTDIIPTSERVELARVIGGNLRQARKAAGMTVEKAAAAVGMSKAAIVGYELGTRNTTAHRLFALCRAYRASVTSVLGVTGSEDYDAGFRDGWRECRAKAYGATGDADVEAVSSEAGAGREDGEGA